MPVARCRFMKLFACFKNARRLKRRAVMLRRVVAVGTPLRQRLPATAEVPVMSASACFANVTTYTHVSLPAKHKASRSERQRMQELDASIVSRRRAVAAPARRTLPRRRTA